MEYYLFIYFYEAQFMQTFNLYDITSIFRIAFMFVIVGLDSVYHTQYVRSKFPMNGSKGSFVISTKPKAKDAFHTTYMLSSHAHSIKGTVFFFPPHVITHHFTTKLRGTDFTPNS